MTREELIILRREASHWIRKLQALDGFAARRAKIPELPDPVARHEWSAVIGYLDGAHSTPTVWNWMTLADANAAGYPQQALARFDKRGSGRAAEVLVPQRDPGPVDDATLEAIARYREGIERFVEDLLVRKATSDDAAHTESRAVEAWAGAVHRAIRDQRPIRLPPLPSGPSVPAPRRLQLDVERGDPIPYDIVVVLKEFASAAGTPELVSEMSGGNRDRTWERSLVAMQKRLVAGEVTSPTERSAVWYARGYLRAAATGELPPGKKR